MPRPTSQLTKWSEAEHEQSHRVGWYELDFNWHLSNTHYLGLLLDSIPSSFLRDHFPSLIRIHYKQEAQLDDVVCSESGRVDSSGFRHRLLRDNTILAEGESVWQAI